MEYYGMTKSFAFFLLFIFKGLERRLIFRRYKQICLDILKFLLNIGEIKNRIKMNRKMIKDGFTVLAQSHAPYLSQWYLDTPVVITSPRYDELHRVQRLLNRTIQYFVGHYQEYYSIFPRTDAVKRIMHLCAPYAYRPGTYRPDILIRQDGALKICEIGARFPLNGYFLSGIAEYIGATRFPYTPRPEGWQYECFLNHLFEYWGDFQDLCVLKGSDRPCDIKYYIPWFEEMGIRVRVYTPEEITKTPEVLKGAAVVNEFNQMELECLPSAVLEAIAASNALNDMRSIFLIHDKRFLAVLSDDEFLSHCLEEAELMLLKRYLIPTYTRLQSPAIWTEAYRYKNDWLVKHALLGKSEKVYAGCLCQEEEWKALFDLPEIEDMILQPYIQQKRIRANIGNQSYDDYVVGTLLCFDNCFFGPGLFRASSYEITNRVDDRKMSPCMTDDLTINNDILIL